MHFPVFLSSIHNEPLGKLGVVFSGTQTRLILPYEASLSFRNPFRFQLPPHRSLAAPAVAFGRQPRVEGNCMCREAMWGGSQKQNGFLNVSEAS